MALLAMALLTIEQLQPPKLIGGIGFTSSNGSLDIVRSQE